jgi:recombination protein RecR
MYSASIQKLIDQFAKLPSIGPKTAERLVFYLLRSKPEEMDAFAQSLLEIKAKITTCHSCFCFAESDPCPICADLRRNRKLLCVATKPQDIETLEKTKIFDGVYFLLGGNINPLEPEKNLRLRELVEKIKTDRPEEIILALNPDLPGETTLLYLKKLLANFPNLKVSRLARGLPMGADLEYADEVTLENALKGRQNLN